jgi:hypothetical protein
MFYRSKFVTNSSSTSFIAFGIWLNTSYVLDLCEYFIKQDPAEAKEILEEHCYLDPGDIDMELFEKDPRRLLEEADADRAFLRAALEKAGLYFEGHYDGNIFYVCIGYPDVRLDKKGVAYIKDPEALMGGYATLKKLIKDLELTDKKIEELQDSWYD